MCQAWRGDPVTGQKIRARANLREVPFGRKRRYERNGRDARDERDERGAHTAVEFGVLVRLTAITDPTDKTVWSNLTGRV